MWLIGVIRMLTLTLQIASAGYRKDTWKSREKKNSVETLGWAHLETRRTFDVLSRKMFTDQGSLSCEA